jgi:hypothetical protein
VIAPPVTAGPGVAAGVDVSPGAVLGAPLVALDASGVVGDDSFALCVATGTCCAEVHPTHTMTNAIAQTLRGAIADGFTKSGAPCIGRLGQAA